MSHLLFRFGLFFVGMGVGVVHIVFLSVLPWGMTDRVPGMISKYFIKIGY